MKTAAQVDIRGFFQEDVIRDMSFFGVEPIESRVATSNPDTGVNEIASTIIGYVIGEPVPQGLFMPKWNFDDGVWEEGLTAEEIAEVTKEPEYVPTELDVLGQQLVAVEIMALDNAQASDMIGQQAVHMELEIMSLGQRSVTSEIDTMTIGQQIVALDLENNHLKTQVSEMGTLILGLQEDAAVRDELLADLQKQINELKGGGTV